MNDRPKTFDGERFSFRTDNAGNQLVVRPRDLLIKESDAERVRDALASIAVEVFGESSEKYSQAILEDNDPVRARSGFFLYRLAQESPLDLFRAIEGLREAGFAVQPNHTYFIASSFISPNYVTPNYVTPNYVTPNYVTPNYVTPNYVTPNYVTPTHGHPGGAPCCCGGGLSDGSENRVGIPPLRARPVPAQVAPVVQRGADLEIHVLDVVNPTGAVTNPTGELIGDPELGRIDENRDAWCDPGVAHGYFVKSIIELTCHIETKLWQGIGPIGDISDFYLAEALAAIGADATAGKKILNLSLAGYNENDRPAQVLRDAISQLLEDGWLIVAAAGNNASCRPIWPAALPGVISVGAIDRLDRPAPFTNFGDWVDACALGVEVAAQFPRLDNLPKPFRVVDEPPINTSVFSTGWATWDGTSFAAPLVAARLADRLQQGDSYDEAVDLLIRDPGRRRIPGLGTIVR